jgi:MFS family permease
MTDKKFPYFRTFLTSMGYFTLNLTWSVFVFFVPIFLKNNLQPIVGDVPVLYTIIGVIMILDNIAAVIIQPYIGHLSDRIWIKKLGRRMPFIIIGIPLGAFFFGLIGTFNDMLYLLIFAICGFNISMALFNSPVISLIPDSLPEKYHSQGNGVMNVVGGLANIVGLLFASYLYKIRPALAFWGMSIIMIFCLAILILNVREKRDADVLEQPVKRKKLLTSLKEVPKENKFMLLFLLLGVFAHNSGYQIAETFFSNYADEILLFSESKAANILGVFVIIQILLALPAGLLARKIGSLNACIIGVITFLLGFIPLTTISMWSIPIFSKVLTLNGLTFSIEFFAYVLLVFTMGFGWILLTINMLVVVWNLAPEGKTATYTGFYYIFWNTAAIISPFLAGIIIDLITSKTSINGLEFIFLIVAVCYALNFIFLLFVKFKQNQQLKLHVRDKDLFATKIQEKDIPLRFLPLILFGVSRRRDDDAIKTLRIEFRQEKQMLRREIKNKRSTIPPVGFIPFRQDEKTKETLKQIKGHKTTKKEQQQEFRQKVRDIKEKEYTERIREQLSKEKRKKKTMEE